MIVRRNGVPEVCKGCAYFKNDACELLCDPTPENREAFLTNGSCRPGRKLEAWTRWTGADQPDLIQIGSERWLKHDREWVLSKLRRFDAGDWRRIVRGYLLNAEFKAAAKRIKREKEQDSDEPFERMECWDDLFDDERRLQALGALKAVMRISREDAALFVAHVAGEHTGAKNALRRRLALVEWRFMVFFHDVRSDWGSSPEAWWFALEAWKLSPPGEVLRRDAVKRTQARYEGLVGDERAWMEKLYLPGAARSLELLASPTCIGQDAMDHFGNRWREALSLPLIEKKKNDDTSGGAGDSQAPEGASATSVANGDGTVGRIDPTEMMALLDDELDDEAALALLQKLTRPEAKDDRAVFHAIAKADDEERAREAPAAQGWAAYVGELMVAVAYGLKVTVLGGQYAPAARFVRSQTGAAEPEAPPVDETPVIPIAVGEPWEIEVTNTTKAPMWVLAGQWNDEARALVAWGTSHDAVKLEPGQKWPSGSVTETEPGETELLVVGLRSDPKSAPAVSAMSREAMEALGVVGAWRFVVAAERR